MPLVWVRFCKAAFSHELQPARMGELKMSLKELTAQSKSISKPPVRPTDTFLPIYVKFEHIMPIWHKKHVSVLFK